MVTAQDTLLGNGAQWSAGTPRAVRFKNENEICILFALVQLTFGGSRLGSIVKGYGGIDELHKRKEKKRG